MLHETGVFRSIGLMRSLTTLSLAFLLSGCAGAGGPRATADLDSVVAKQDQTTKETRDLNEKFFASLASAPKVEDYVLGQGDLLQITALEANELNVSARVGARGFVTLPLLGPVEVAGITARAAEQKIEDLYRSRRFIRDPHINVFVQEQQSAKVTVMGCVKKPGTFDFPARRHLMDVLAIAEGLSDKAGRVVQVTRTDEATGKVSSFTVDMEAMVKGEDSNLNLEIKKGDVVFVPETGLVYVDGAVRTPGNYPIKNGMSVAEAIVAAGGRMSIADKSKVKLVRSNADGKRQIVDIDEKDPSNPPEALQLKDRDVVYVETSPVRSLFYGLNLNLLGYGMGYNPPSR